MNYDHYIGLDWAKTNMAVARMTNSSKETVVVDVKANVKANDLAPKKRTRSYAALIDFDSYSTGVM